MFIDLSEKERLTLQYISENVDEKGYPPSIREICSEIGFRSTSTAYSCLKSLEDKGYIRKDPSKPRAIEVINSVERMGFEKKKTVDIPLVGQVTAGQPILAVENIDEYFPIPKEWISDNDHFILNISGDSMYDAGIYDGDIVVVEKTTIAKNGDIVVALIDGEYTTVKRFYKEKDHIRLQPENESYEPIISNDVSILGKIKLLIRRDVL
ncbi:MAG: transcriptional repressor LexA [Filifactor alocis]|nr:transcriptional repressor LexA [Filifactor alocis]